MRKTENGFAWPSWLEKKRIPDSWLAEAYNHAPASCRSAIKTGMALSHFHFGERPTLIKRERSSQRLGLEESFYSTPACWSVLIIDSSFCAAAQVSAAAILPALAGANPPLLICIGEKPNPAILTSAELCGIEDAMALKEEECGNFLKDMGRVNWNEGRIVFLHHGSLNNLVNLAREQNLAVYNADKKPRALLLTPEAFDRETLLFCLGELPETGAGALQAWDAIYCAPPHETPYARLLLEPGCEGFWLYAGLGLDFFRIPALKFKFVDSAL